MTEIEVKNDKNSVTEIPAIPSAPASAPLLSEESAKMLDDAAEGAIKIRLEQRKKTIGEKIYNRTVYTGIGWFANEIGSMIFTGIFERGKNKWIGRESFEKVSAWMDKKWNFAEGVKGANNLLVWASLNVIGCFVVPAIKIVDNYKFGLVKRLNHRFGSKGMSQAAIAARDKEVEEAIACEPTQSWGTLWMGRIAAIAANLTLGHGILQDKGNQRLKGAFDKGLTKAADTVGLNKLTTGQAYHPDVKAHEMSPFHYYAQLSGPETLGCISGSIVLEIASKFFAKHWPRVKDPKIAAQVKERGKTALIAAAQSGSDGSTTAPRGIKALAAARPSESYAERVASEPTPTLGAGV